MSEGKLYRWVKAVERLPKQKDYYLCKDDEDEIEWYELSEIGLHWHDGEIYTVDGTNNNYLSTVEWLEEISIPTDLQDWIKDEAEKYANGFFNELVGVNINTRPIRTNAIKHIANLLLPIVQKLKEELKILEDWKESAMSVMSPLREIGQVLGVRLGDSIHDKILPGIRKLKEENELYTNRLFELNGIEHELKKENEQLRKRLGEVEK